MNRVTPVWSSIVSIFLLLIGSGCTTTAPVVTTDEAVSRLFEARRDFPGANSVSSVRVTGRGGRSFRASIAIDPHGNMALTALTPFGTAAAHIRVEGDRVTLVNHLRNLYWEGTIRELSGANPLADVLRVEGLPFLLTGLPPWLSADRVRREMMEDGRMRLSDRDISLVVGSSGMVSGTVWIGAQEVNVRFREPAIPASGVEVSSPLQPERMVRFEHLNLELGPVVIEPIEIPADYRRTEFWESVVE